MTKLHLDHTSSIETIDNYTSTLTSIIQTTITQNIPQAEVKTHSTDIDNTTQDLTEKTMGKNENTTLQNCGEEGEYNITKQ